MILIAADAASYTVFEPMMYAFEAIDYLLNKMYRAYLAMDVIRIFRASKL